MKRPLALLVSVLAPALAAAQAAPPPSPAAPTAFIQAVEPGLVHRERYQPEMATAYPAPNTWIAYPFPSGIGLYKEGEGHPRFDAAQAKTYFTRVTDKVAGLVQDTIRKWDDAGL